jgi:hypothetical protein
MEDEDNKVGELLGGAPQVTFGPATAAATARNVSYSPPAERLRATLSDLTCQGQAEANRPNPNLWYGLLDVSGACWLFQGLPKAQAYVGMGNIFRFSRVFKTCAEASEGTTEKEPIFIADSESSLDNNSSSNDSPEPKNRQSRKDRKKKKKKKPSKSSKNAKGNPLRMPKAMFFLDTDIPPHLPLPHLVVTHQTAILTPQIAALTGHDNVGMAEKRRPLKKPSAKVKSSKRKRSSLEMTPPLETANGFMIFLSTVRRSIRQQDPQRCVPMTQPSYGMRQLT